MVKCLILVLVLLGSIQASSAQSSSNDANLNLGFEQVSDGNPQGWYLATIPGYSIQLDSTMKHSGHSSVRIRFDGDSATYTAVSRSLPFNYSGKTITLSGYIKTEHVSDGGAALWMRIDPKIAFDNMDARKITGTTDWKKYEIQLKLDPARSKMIIIGGMLIGKGKMWLDDLEVKIDGKPLSAAAVFAGNFPADKDTSFSQGSGITHIGTDRQTLENLNVLGLVWGYLKYYHPSVAKGTHNWSNKLFRLLPKVTAARTDAARDTILSGFISGLGPVKSGAYKQESAGKEPVKFAPDTTWFTTAGLSAELHRQLSTIYGAERPADSYYFDFADRVGNVVFEHERNYPEVDSTDVGLRLLALFRYWNAIQYFSPYRYLIDDWQKVLTDYIPIMINSDDRLKYEKALSALIAETFDTHGSLSGKTIAMHQYYGTNVPALGICFVEGKWVVNRYLDSLKSDKTGILLGDVILQVDGRPVNDIVKERLKLTAASNLSTKYRNISWTLLRTNQGLMHLTIDRAGERIEKAIKTYPLGSLPLIQFADKSKPPFSILPSGVGYLYPGTIKNSDLDSIMRRAAGTKGLIIDLRCYPSEFVVFTLGAKLAKKQVDFVKFSFIDHQFPGRAIMGPPLHLGKRNPAAYKGKVVVLVNEYTQSQAEYTSMAFRATGATIIGSTTAGADGNVSNVLLPGGMSTWFSGLGVYYTDGKETQQVGIVPDIYCGPTIDGIRQGKDEPLERAIQYIQTGK